MAEWSLLGVWFWHFWGHASLCTRITVCMPPCCHWDGPEMQVEEEPGGCPSTNAWLGCQCSRGTGFPEPGSCRRKESGLDRWAAPSAVVRSTWCPVPCGLRLGAGAHSAALDLRWESPQPLAQSPLLCPMSLVPFSTQVTSGLRLSPQLTASPGLRSLLRPGLSTSCPVFVQENRLLAGPPSSGASGRGPWPL